MSRVLSTLALAATFLFDATADAALTTGKCLAEKRQAWGTLRKCEAGAESKILKGKTGDLAKCQAKFQEKLAKITAKAAKAGVDCRYGGGTTVTDYDTGLEWEKKNGGSGLLCLPNDPHCVNETFTWDEAFAFASAGTLATTITTCFADHCDWRLPTRVELQTILVLPCSGSCIDPVFGSNAVFYWTATSFVSVPTSAFRVSFADGNGAFAPKSGALSVRLMRPAL